MSDFPRDVSGNMRFLPYFSGISSRVSTRISSEAPGVHFMISTQFILEFLSIWVSLCFRHIALPICTRVPIFFVEFFPMVSSGIFLFFSNDMSLTFPGFSQQFFRYFSRSFPRESSQMLPREFLLIFRQWFFTRYF